MDMLYVYMLHIYVYIIFTLHMYVNQICTVYTSIIVVLANMLVTACLIIV